jgi:phenylpropionate dioxygenase-like ring-hydroxylating dioxygenase large terminal subunit
MKTDDPVAMDQWYAIETLAELAVQPRQLRLLGQDLAVCRDAAGAPRIQAAGRALPVRQRYGCLWTTLGAPARGIPDIAEAAEPDRRFLLCGWTQMRASGLRMVENFLDMAHFPFVHTGILGAEPHTEVPHYAAEIRRDVDEVWATNCRFYQPRIATTETTGDFAQLTYRVLSPFNVLLYRVSPSAPTRLDVIALFITPIEPDLCRAQPVMWLIDPVSSHTDLLRFEQVIFLQDRIIVENQRPVLLPLDARSEIPTRADSASIVYRRWLKEKGISYGTV